jgi:methylated-DNA-[protein]-cysteine S-methyltransferase
VKRLSFPFHNYWFNVSWVKETIEASNFSLTPEYEIFSGKDRDPLAIKIVLELERYLQKGQFDSNSFKLNLDIYPSFFRKVLSELRSLRPGEVITYGELAKRVGNPQAARAVGQAMKKNQHLLFIPCHRVVGNRGLGGWSGPQGLKEFLLLLERH